jgi:hypothetical protein
MTGPDGAGDLYLPPVPQTLLLFSLAVSRPVVLPQGHFAPKVAWPDKIQVIWK